MTADQTEKTYIATCECMSCVNRLGPAHCETVEQVCCGTRYPMCSTPPAAEGGSDA